ncbi:hypothetical protein [Corynebacterium matruchotii]|uniref:hypothetical protein n=1 Tax=Corynebacterium matruchotii TaxID=43768 RepID=UPI002432D344|nr:hypothetical protein [Corynebacterium matruchotii]
MAILIRNVFTALLSALIIVFLGSGVASADPADESNEFQKAYQKCRGDSTEGNDPPRKVDEQSPGTMVDKIKQTLCVDSSVIKHPGEAVETAVEKKASQYWKDPVGKLAKAIKEGNTELLQLVMTFWMGFEVLPSKDLSANITGVKYIVWGVAGFALIASFLVGGARLAAARRTGLQEGVEEIGLNVGRWLIFSLCIPIVVPGALAASDQLSSAIMNQFGVKSAESFIQIASFNDSELGPIVTLVLLIVCIAGSLMQILALIVRVLILPIAAGLAPLFAALSFTETGRNGLHHLVGYMIAAVAFKPVCALLYAVVIWNVSRPGSGDTVVGAVINTTMIALSGLIAPSLTRMVVPMVSQAGGMGGGALLSSAASATGAVLGGMGPMSAGGLAGGLGSALGAMGGAGAHGMPGMSGGAGFGSPLTVGSGGGSFRGGGSRASGDSVPAGSGGSSGSGGAGGAGGARFSKVSTAAVPTGAGGGGGSGRMNNGARANGVQPSRFKRASAAGSLPQGVHNYPGGQLPGSSGSGTPALRNLGTMASRAGNAVKTTESMFEGSLGYPGQVHR